jgi:hypothetical protein
MITVRNKTEMQGEATKLSWVNDHKLALFNLFCAANSKHDATANLYSKLEKETHQLLVGRLSPSLPARKFVMLLYLPLRNKNKVSVCLSMSKDAEVHVTYTGQAGTS